MKKIIFCLGVTTLLLSGCGTTSTDQSSTQKVEQAVVTKIGTVTTKVGSEYLLNTEEGIINITSSKTNLDNYLKKKIKVTGMFSGSTLYVDKVEEN